jgi:HEAT repeat protein
MVIDTASAHRFRGQWRAGRGFLILLAVATCCFAGCSGTPSQRRSSIYDLSDDPTPANVERIRSFLDDPDRDVRATAMNVLVGLEVADAVDIALAGLEDPDGFVRATASKLVGDTGDPRHAELLALHLLEDSDPVVRQRAAEALTRVGGSAAVQALGAGIQDPMEQVRLASVEGLRKLGPDPASAGLARLLLEDTVWEVRAQAARALGSSTDEATIAALEGALTDPNEFVRSAATNALRMRGRDVPD